MPLIDPLPFRLNLPDRDSVNLTGIKSVSYRVKGLLHLDEDSLTLEWAAIRKTEGITLTGVLDEVDYSPIASVVLKASWIAEARVVGGWWVPRLRLRARHLAAFERVPGARGDALELRIHRRDRALAGVVVAAIASGGDESPS